MNYAVFVSKFSKKKTKFSSSAGELPKTSRFIFGDNNNNTSSQFLTFHKYIFWRRRDANSGGCLRISKGKFRPDRRVASLKCIAPYMIYSKLFVDCCFRRRIYAKFEEECSQSEWASGWTGSWNWLCVKANALLSSIAIECMYTRNLYRYIKHNVDESIEFKLLKCR